RMPARWPFMTASVSKTTGAPPARYRSDSLRGDADVRHLPLPANAHDVPASASRISGRTSATPLHSWPSWAGAAFMGRARVVSSTPSQIADDAEEIRLGVS